MEKDTHSGWSFEDGLELAHALVGAVHAERTLDFGCCAFGERKPQVNDLYEINAKELWLTVLLQEQSTAYAAAKSDTTSAPILETEVPIKKRERERK